MSINLQKGQKIDLTKGGVGLSKVMVGLGWDQARKKRSFFGFGGGSDPIDCDASIILCDDTGKVITKPGEGCVFFNNLKHPSGAIVHQGDNRTGEGDGDDEVIMLDFSRIPSYVHKMVFVVNIYEGTKHNQHFGMIENAYIRLVDLSARKEICRYNLSDNYDGMTGLIVGEVYRRNGEWKFNAIGQPVREASYLSSLIEMYE